MAVLIFGSAACVERPDKEYLAEINKYLYSIPQFSSNKQGFIAELVDGRISPEQVGFASESQLMSSVASQYYLWGETAAAVEIYEQIDYLDTLPDNGRFGVVSYLLNREFVENHQLSDKLQNVVRGFDLQSVMRDRDEFLEMTDFEVYNWLAKYRALTVVRIDLAKGLFSGTRPRSLEYAEMLMRDREVMVKLGGISKEIGIIFQEFLDLFRLVERYYASAGEDTVWVNTKCLEYVQAIGESRLNNKDIRYVIEMKGKLPPP